MNCVLAREPGQEARLRSRRPRGKYSPSPSFPEGLGHSLRYPACPSWVGLLPGIELIATINNNIGEYHNNMWACLPRRPVCHPHHYYWRIVWVCRGGRGWCAGGYRVEHLHNCDVFGFMPLTSHGWQQNSLHRSFYSSISSATSVREASPILERYEYM